MGILGFLFTSFIIWLLFLLLKAGLRVYRTYKNINSAFRQGSSHQTNVGDNEKGEGSSWFTWGKRQSQKRSKPNKKIIPNDYGEYVEFTESSNATPDATSDDKLHSSTSNNYKESQIEDAEWEEIK